MLLLPLSFSNTTKISIILITTKHILYFNITLTQNIRLVNFVLMINFYLHISKIVTIFVLSKLIKQ